MSEPAIGQPLLAPGRWPVRSANVGRNLLADGGRAERWRGVRDRLWALLDPLVGPGSRVAVVGAGNAHDLPLTRLAVRSNEVVLIDIDGRALGDARRRAGGRPVRRRITVIEHDVTDGAGDSIVTAAARAEVPDRARVVETPLPGAPYDVVIGDLFYSQLLYPAMIDLGVPAERQRWFLERYGPALVRGVVSRLHASAPCGAVVHVHDPLGWWPGHGQPVALQGILDAARTDPVEALRLAGQGRGPGEADPRAALTHFAIPVHATALWRWPFAPGTDYLVCATTAHTVGV
jgi:hypothetical protein